MAIKAIGFDLGGVILGSIYAGDFFGRLSQRMNVPETKLRTAIQANDPTYQKGELTPEQYWRKVAKQVGAIYSQSLLDWPVEDFESHSPLDRQILLLVDRLKEHGYRLGLLSNTNSQYLELNRTRHIFEHFDVALMSNEIDAVKPEPAAFYKLAEALQVAPAETVFIDDLPENIDGAQTVGMTGILYKGYDDLIAKLESLGVEV